jgi:imidazole glycerol phosphate synthase glutamine amidotransferase subunit
VRRVAICDYGAGNVRSVALAFAALGVRAETTTDAEAVLAADLAVLPGVGSAQSAMETLRATSLDVSLRERAAAGRPTLGICLGLQLALEGSDEDGGVDGLGLLAGRARRLEHGRVPRIGWAPVKPSGETFYFAHSFAADTPAATAWSEGIVAEARSDGFTGVQFHPEKSADAGARYLERCLSRA